MSEKPRWVNRRVMARQGGSEQAAQKMRRHSKGRKKWDGDEEEGGWKGEGKGRGETQKAQRYDQCTNR